MDYLISNIWRYVNTAVFGTAEYQTLCVLIGLILLIVFFIPGREIGQKVLIAGLLIYLFLVFSSTVMIRVGNLDDPLKFIAPFTEYRSAFTLGGFKYDIVENILLFLPAGVLMSVAGDYKHWFLPIIYLSLFSCCIELLQGLLKVGYTEFDDWFNNTLGAAIGVFIPFMLRKMQKKS